MERLGETKEREKGNEKKKQRRSNCLEYFKEKHDKEIEIRREEIELRKRDMAIKEKEVVGALDIKVREGERKTRDENMRARNESNMVATLQQQLQQQQAMFLQMQQQTLHTALLLELFNNIKK